MFWFYFIGGVLIIYIVHKYEERRYIKKIERDEERRNHDNKSKNDIGSLIVEKANLQARIEEIDHFFETYKEIDGK